MFGKPVKDEVELDQQRRPAEELDVGARGPGPRGGRRPVEVHEREREPERDGERHPEERNEERHRRADAEQDRANRAEVLARSRSPQVRSSRVTLRVKSASASPPGDDAVWAAKSPLWSLGSRAPTSRNMRPSSPERMILAGSASLS